MTHRDSPKPYLFTDNNPLTTEDYATSIRRLKKPEGKVDVVLDTDPFNEVDDQYALAYLLQNADRLHLRAIMAAPFLNHHSKSPADGMERSYREVFHVLDLCHTEFDRTLVYRGATDFLPNETTYRDSKGIDAIAEIAQDYSPEHPLYVIGIAAATNLASLLLKHPKIKDNLFVIWLGGMGFDWHDNASFNAGQDVAAARVLLDSGVPLVLIPGRGVLDKFLTTQPELEYWLRGQNEFCDYIVDKTIHEAELIHSTPFWSRPISDVVAVAWLLEEKFMLDRVINCPVMQYDNHYSIDYRRPFIRYVYSVNRDLLMEDLFTKLSAL